MTTRASIARYWASSEGRRRWPNADIDIGEPSCMACGYFARSWDKGRAEGARWNHATLDRAHVVAASAGGPDTPSNYVLLCAKCHAAAPMTRDERVMFAWCERRPSYVSAQMNDLRSELANLGVDLESLSGLAALPLEELRERLKRAAGDIDAGSHLCHMSASTRAVALVRMSDDLAAERAVPRDEVLQLSLFCGET